MKEIIVTIGLILLGIVVFGLIMGVGTGGDGLVGNAGDFFQNMMTQFDFIKGTDKINP